MTKTIAQHAAAARAYDTIHNEGGAGHNPYWAAHDAAVGEAVEARLQEVIANFDNLRAAWNAEVAKHTTAQGVPAKAIPLIEKAVGATMNEMKSAKARLAK